MSSLVIAACRALLYLSVSLEIMSFALRVELSIAVMRAPYSEASDSKNVSDKLDEIKAKLEVMKDSVESQDVVIKTYFENGD